MLAVVEGPITDVRKPCSWLWRHCRRRAIYWLLRSLPKLVSVKPKTQNQQAPDATSFFPVGGIRHCAKLAWKTSSSEKSDAVALQRLRSVALYLWLIVVISVKIDRCSNIWASLPGAGYGQFEHKADSLIAKFKEAGGTVREIDVWAESPRLSPLWLSASSSACHGLLIITDNAITYKAQRDKNAREAGERGNYWHADASKRDVAALDANS